MYTRAFGRRLAALAALITLSLSCSFIQNVPLFGFGAADEGGEPTEEAGTSSDGPSTAEPTATLANVPSPTPTILHLTRPAEPGAIASAINDRSSQTTAVEGRAAAEAWASNILERPFTAESMTYQPQLDLVRAELSTADSWLYILLSLESLPAADASAQYGVELDMNVDGRGDLLVAGRAPAGTDWTTEGVWVYRDGNGDVGGTSPARADDSADLGDGYERTIFAEGEGDDPDLAWIRRAPSGAPELQLAIKLEALDGDLSFAWRPFADDGLKDPGQFDYHDRFSLVAAGSPLTDDAEYPLKAVASFDNSCAWSMGFTPTGAEPGLCPLPATPTPTAPPATATPQPGAIYGLVWTDNDLDGVKDSGEPPNPGMTVRLGAGACPVDGLSSTTTEYISYTANFRFDSLTPGTYCVTLNYRGDLTTGSNRITVQVPAAGEAVANFGIWPNG